MLEEKLRLDGCIQHRPLEALVCCAWEVSQVPNTRRERDRPRLIWVDVVRLVFQHWDSSKIYLEVE